MWNRHNLVAGVMLALLGGGLVVLMCSAAGHNPNAAPSQPPHDAIADAQTPRAVPAERPEQKKTAHDRSDIFVPGKEPPTTKALANQTDKSQFLGFDLESRYNLEPKLDPEARMSRGKPLAVGPTVKLPAGLDSERLAASSWS